ncbi:DNA repair MMS21 protein [Fusarium globosum]|uniref:DNA repair MMS21 protein n=1 Tax=Fusarium globosum TaxID=78864 RepID=A0A8H5Y754_9HYPO|nr:DNA repair MMS21 protein [Fusarium globosum]
MSRRAINRTGNSSTELPGYEPPACPLTDTARRKLHDLSNSRSTAAYQQQINESVRLLGFSVSDIHERLRMQREELSRLKLRREEKGTEKSEDELRLEAHLPELEERINTLTAASEQAIRDMIDRRAELEDEDAMFSELHDTASAEAAQQRQVDAQRSEQDDEQEPRGATSLLELYKEMRQKKDTEYTKMSAHQRYALNNDYAGFKKLWHDAMAGDEGPPLPDASRWFTADGEPIMTGDVKGAGAGVGDDDDDIAVEREVKSINCPLTLQPMKDPYTNRNCKHTFEMAALLEYLPMRGESQCPQAGCSQKFTRARFDHEFFQDQAMARRIKRVRLAQQQQEMMDEEDEGDGDDELRVRGSQAVPGRPLKREKRGE